MLSIVVLTGTAYANEDHKHDAGYSAVEAEDGQLYTGDVKVNVTGMVCDFCAQALEKVFGKQEAVSGIDVNLDDAFVKVSLKDGQSMEHDKLVKLIVDSGYNVESIEHAK